VGEGEAWKQFPINNARIEEKRDGSLISVYWDGNQWCVSTRKMAYAEGTTIWGKSFRDLFEDAAKKTSVWDYLNSHEMFKRVTWVFELTSPENRVVTRYPNTSITLIGARNNELGTEIGGSGLDSFAASMRVNRPKYYRFRTMDDVKNATRELDTLDEGFVLVSETEGSFWRLKCKNDRYVAIAHMRENGQISPKNILTMIMANESAEYISYFEEDRRYFDFVEPIYKEAYDRIVELKNKYMAIENQKEFALTIMPLCKYGFEKGILFSIRKGGDLDALLLDCGAKKIAKDLNLKARFAKEFNINVEEEE
jgi:hypothetical protein